MCIFKAESFSFCALFIAESFSFLLSVVESFLSVWFIAFAFLVLHDANEGSVISLVSAFLF